MKLRGFTFASAKGRGRTLTSGLQLSSSVIKKKYFFFFLLAFSWGVHLQAQQPLKAGSMNVFTPVKTAKTIDILGNSNLSTCGASTGIVITTFPKHGNAVNNGADIKYTPNSDFVGQDSLKYRLTCGTQQSEAIVLINVGDKPEVVNDNACAVPPVPFAWGIKQLAISSEIVSSFSSPRVGDVDNDGKSEIVIMSTTPSSPAYMYSEHLYIYGFDESRTPNNPLYLKYDIPIPRTGVSGNTYVLANVDEDGYSSIFLTTSNTYISGDNARQLIKYKFNGSSWEEKWRRTFSTNTDNINWSSCPPLVADFMASGHVQVAVYDKVWNAKDGTLLVDGGLLGIAGNNFGIMPHSGGSPNNTTYPKVASWAVADIDNDGQLEIVAGNCVYKVNIANPDASDVNNTYTRITVADAAISDGGISIADIDMDGQLDVVIVFRDGSTTKSGAMAIYDPRTGNLMSDIIREIPVQGTATGAGGPSIPFIGDITGDGTPKIVHIGANIMYAYQYDRQSKKFDRLWTHPIVDPSGATVMSLFDFNQDGISELIYRDEQRLRIINGSGKSHITGADTLLVYDLTFFSPVLSSTVNEYPIVVDIDGDGSAEIITTGHPSTTGGYGYLRIYASNDPDVLWAPARTVWDRFYYNPLYINGDLTIPQHPLNPATFFVDKNGNRHQPFNNFLQQATLLNGEGKMLAYGPNLKFDDDGVIYSNYNGATVDVKFTVENTGDAPLKNELYVSTYILKKGTYEILQTNNIPGEIGKGDNKLIEYQVSSLPTDGGTIIPADILQIRLNDNGTSDYPQEQCNYSGNVTLPAFYAPEYNLCPGPNTIYFYPQNNPGFKYYWYTHAPTVDDTDGVEGESFTFTKNPTDVKEDFYVQVYDLNDNLVGSPFSVRIFLVPDTLVWTGAVDSDWHDPQNWDYPDGVDYSDYSGQYIKYRVPGDCTNVLIPGGITTTYPDLQSASTNYTETAAYTGALCDFLYFAPGSELLRTDLLTYNKALIDLKVQSNRWYMFSPPLLDMYSGDFYLTDPDPAKDEQTAYTMLFNAENPETGQLPTVSGEWTGAFNVPNVLLEPGSGLALWIDDGGGYGDYADITFRFPKNDVNHYIYNPDRYPGGNISGTYPTSRPKNGHFAHERSSNGNVTLKDIFGRKNGDILVGNPFMAHLDFNKLYEDNYNVLSGNGYKLASGVAIANGEIKDFYSYQRNGDKYVSTSPDPEDNTSGFIPPMQAFVITVNSGEVTANISNHTRISTALNDVFRAANQEAAGSNRSSSLLNIIATRGEDASKAIILQNETSTTSYAPSEDSYKLFISKIMDSDEVLKHIQVYTRSSDGYALDINSIGTSEQDITVPLGIRTSEKGGIVLNFSGMENFGESTGIYLYDAQHPKRLIDLKTQPEYAFDKTEDTLYLENRLSLVIGKALQPLGIETASESSAIRVLSLSPRKLKIVSESGNALGNVRITDAWGRIVLDDLAVSSSIYEYQTPAPGIYVVRIGAEVKKVVSIR
ncbi:MAG: hypothetical protein LBM08_05795 [Dysgonamonadaceae bacterium]|jgi:hypothetical protein|nr:hypothetical protein [Dysgonamonadaceae bacterium]